MARARGRSLKLLFVTLICASLLSGAQGCTWRKKADGGPRLTLRLPLVGSLNTLDPALASDPVSADETMRAYETLLQYHFLKRPNMLMPGLAEFLPEVTQGGRVLTFQLRKGVLFQDDRCFHETSGRGREMIADDVVFSLKRIADPRLESAGWRELDGKIIGLNEWRSAVAADSATAYSKEVEGLRVIDRYTLEIKLTAPDPQFPFVLAMPFTAVVPREAVLAYGADFANHPVGTGPYRLHQHRPGSRLLWARNPTYRRDTFPVVPVTEEDPRDRESGLMVDAGKPLPLVERIQVDFFEEPSPAWKQLLEGELDLAPVPKDALSRVLSGGGEFFPEIKGKGFALKSIPRMDIVYISFNMSDPILGRNKLLRQALSLAFGASEFVESSRSGRAQIAHGPVPPGMEGYDPGFINPYSKADVARARELLAKAGYPGGTGLPELEFAIGNDPEETEIAGFAKTRFAAIGVGLRAVSYTPSELESVKKERKTQLWISSLLAQSPDGENFLRLLQGAKGAARSESRAAYSNPELERLLGKASALVLADPKEGSQRAAILRLATRILADDCPWIFLFHRVEHWLVHPRVRNYKPHPFGHGMAKHYRVEAAAGMQ